MSEHNHPRSQPTSARPAQGGLSLKWTFAILGLCFLFVLMPYLFWQQTWFGRPLSDTQIAENLADKENPRKVQHALAQIVEAMVRREPGAQRWYPQVAQLARHSVDEIRVTAAWAMGQDNTVPEFHQALLTLLRDANPMVRRNAALALVRFQDGSGHDEIVSLLGSYTLAAPFAGTLDQRLQPGDAVNPGTLVGRIKVGQEDREVRSPVPGVLARWLAQENSTVVQEQEILEVSPGPAQIWEALRALVLVGQPADIPLIRPFLALRSDLPEQVRLQAREAIRAIEKRADQMLKPPPE